MTRFSTIFLNGITFTAAAWAQSTTSAYTPATSTSSSPFQLYTITADNITAVVVPYGARLTSLLVPDKKGAMQDIVLGYDTGEEYVNDTQTIHSFYGAVVGRYANRIKNSTFSIDGESYHIPANENGGLDTLHGGNVGYDQRNWTVSSVSESSVSMTLLDDNFEGFPGKVLTTASWSVSSYPSGPQGQMRPRLTTKLVSIALDHKTPIMLSNHIYWNLNAFQAADMLNDTTFYMPYSTRYIEVDNILIPTGEIGTVSNKSALNFLTPQGLGKAIDQAQGLCGFNCTGIDNAFILDRPSYTAQDDAGIKVLSMWSTTTGIQLDLSTNQQGIQIYSCNSQNGSALIKPSQAKRNQGIEGATDVVNKHGCAAIEPQAYIDGINNPQWGVDKYEIFGPDTGPAVNFATYDFSTF